MPELPGKDERDKAEALDRALGRGPGSGWLGDDVADPHGASSAAGPRPDELRNPAALDGSAELVALASRLRRALPMPELPGGGAAEVRAAALAVRAIRRRNRGRLLVAAVITLLVGAVAGGTLSTIFQKPSPPGTDLAQLSVAVKEYGGDAKTALAHHQVAAAQRYIQKLYTVIYEQGVKVAPPAKAPSVTDETAEIASLEHTVKSLEAEVDRLEAAATVKSLSSSSPASPSAARPPKSHGANPKTVVVGTLAHARSTSTTVVVTSSPHGSGASLSGNPHPSHPATSLISKAPTTPGNSGNSGNTGNSGKSGNSGQPGNSGNSGNLTKSGSKPSEGSGPATSTTTSTTTPKTTVPVPTTIATTTTTAPPRTTPVTNGLGVTAPVRLPTTTTSTTTTSVPPTSTSTTSSATTSSTTSPTTTGSTTSTSTSTSSTTSSSTTTTTTSTSAASGAPTGTASGLGDVVHAVTGAGDPAGATSVPKATTTTVATTTTTSTTTPIAAG
ncbi:MAG TPA: hypothetical protein VL984_01330 [Acidimicrobiales bacterium]|nr:hypothetical protein [Acidimicrobiales bacterium]